MGKDGFDFHEEAWNAYPYCKTVITNPGYMKDGFKVIIESLHLPDNGKTENGLEKTTEELASVVVELLDIATQKNNLTQSNDGNPATYSSKRSGRGPLDANNWMHTTNPIMTCYKTVSVYCKWFGLQNKIENFMMDQYRKMFLAFHQQIWCWTDEWYGITMEDLRKLEDKTKEELKERIKDKDKRGTSDFD